MAIYLTTRLNNIYHGLSKSHKRIANLILENMEKTKDYSCARLAVLSNTSESTVMRFVKTAGYDGYDELKQAMIDDIESKLPPDAKIVKPTREVMCSDLLQKTLAMDVKNIRSTAEYLAKSVFDEIVDLSISSKRKYIIAFGQDSLPAKFLFNNFVTMFDNVSFITSEDDYFALLLTLSKHDQVFVFSITDKSQKLLGLTKYIKSKCATIVVFSEKTTSPLFEFADHFVTVKSETPSFAESFSSVFSIMNALILEIVRKDRVRITNRYKQINKLREDFQK